MGWSAIDDCFNMCAKKYTATTFSKAIDDDGPPNHSQLPLQQHVSHDLQVHVPYFAHRIECELGRSER